jgi:hypothetical protein
MLLLNEARNSTKPFVPKKKLVIILYNSMSIKILLRLMEKYDIELSQ